MVGLAALLEQVTGIRLSVSSPGKTLLRSLIFFSWFGGWIRWSLEVLSKPYNSVILLQGQVKKANCCLRQRSLLWTQTWSEFVLGISFVWHKWKSPKDAWAESCFLISFKIRKIENYKRYLARKAEGIQAIHEWFFFFFLVIFVYSILYFGVSFSYFSPLCVS